MMEKLGSFIVRRRWAVLAVWVVAAIIIVALSPKIATIESDDQSSFLPNTYESVKAENVAKKIDSHTQDATDIVVFKNSDGSKLTTAQLAEITADVKAVSAAHLSHIGSIVTSPQEIAPNKTAQLATITYSGSADATATINSVKTVRDKLSALTKGSDITTGITGEESISYDTQDSSKKALAIVGIGTILLVLILPAFIFRSPLAGLLPVFAVGIVFTVANSLISDAGHLFNFQVSQQLSVLFTVVLFGIGTDYILFLLFRYRERLRSGDHTREAVAYALSRAGEAIFSAALVVLTSFVALFFAKFGIFHSLAPGLVICVAVMMLAALTLVPALVAIIGEKVFWPSKAWMVKAEKPTISKKIGGLVSRRPGLVTGVVVIVLVGFGFAALNFKADFSSFSQPPTGTLSAKAYSDLTQSFPAGTLTISQIYVQSTQPLTKAGLNPLAAKLKDVPGISSAMVAPITDPSKHIAVINVILKNNPYSSASISTVSGPLRDAAHSFDTTTQQVYVGGGTSAIADVQSVTNRDLRVIFPIAALFIFIILAILLRSLVAPLLLLICVSLGYVATLGITTLIFETFGGDAGLISFIPLFMYIFVVAIGTDYNILTVTRLREEIKEGNPPRKAADLTVEHSSATVVSAGLILAATFGSLILGGLSFLSQMGTAISIGVALSAFVIAPFLVPSLSALFGYAIWWPSHRPGTRSNS